MGMGACLVNKSSFFYKYSPGSSNDQCLAKDGYSDANKRVICKPLSIFLELYWFLKDTGLEIV